MRTTPSQPDPGLAWQALAGRERGLFAAVLHRGILDVLQLHGATDGPGRAIHRRARAWVASEEESYIFSFRSTCRALGFRPEQIRRKLAVLSLEEAQGHLSPR